MRLTPDCSTWTIITMRFSPLVCLSVLWLNTDVSLSQNESVGCGSPPPPLTDGDLKYSMKEQYSHNEQVEYICQPYYTMEGQPNRICINGQWTGEPRCLKPCTVTDDDLRQRNIEFRFSNNRKMYAAHNDVIGFKCAERRAVGSMRVSCNDGVMALPTCQ